MVANVDRGSPASSDWKSWGNRSYHTWTSGRKKYISRPAIWANVAAINVHLFEYPVVEGWLVWYANIGIIVALLAFITYATEESLPGWYYKLAWAYSSIPVAALVYLTWAGTL